MPNDVTVTPGTDVIVKFSMSRSYIGVPCHAPSWRSSTYCAGVNAGAVIEPSWQTVPEFSYFEGRLIITFESKLSVITTVELLSEPYLPKKTSWAVALLATKIFSSTACSLET